MKKTLFTLALGLGVAFQVSALQVKVLDTPYNNLTHGGEMTVVPIGGGSAFTSFCLEKSSHLTWGATYDAVANHEAVSGGPGYPNPQNPTGDPISLGTAQLYAGFRSGSLAGYYYGADSALRNTSAAALQYAFWWLEEEMSLSEAQVLANPFLNVLGADLAAIEAFRADNNGQYRVGVLNLTKTVNGQVILAQDVLTLVPDGGSSLILLGAAFTVLGLIRRKA